MFAAPVMVLPEPPSSCIDCLAALLGYRELGMDWSDDLPWSPEYMLEPPSLQKSQNPEIFAGGEEIENRNRFLDARAKSKGRPD